jgi:D-amino-acid oxidase
VVREHIHAENLLKAVVGLRPYRRGSLRLESEYLDSKLWVHNYGHGGSGITLCWGSARWAVQRLLRVPKDPVAVLGAGVIGLTVAALLLKKGYAVTVYAREFPPHTTSDLAGGLWAPTHVAIPDQQLRRDLLSWSWNAFQEIEGSAYGVWPVKLYQGLDSPDPLDPMPSWLTGEGRLTERLPFGPHAPRGIVWDTYLIETSTFLARLVEDLKGSGGVLVERTFSSVDEVQGLAQSIVVNCLGLGAGPLLADDAMVPIRGQLLYMKPVAGRRMVLDHAEGYVISRDDALILGGSFEENMDDITPCPKMTKKILEGNRDFDWS